jgi:hypothetical protein
LLCASRVSDDVQHADLAADAHLGMGPRLLRRLCRWPAAPGRNRTGARSAPCWSDISAMA